MIDRGLDAQTGHRLFDQAGYSFHGGSLAKTASCFGRKKDVKGPVVPRGDVQRTGERPPLKPGHCAGSGLSVPGRQLRALPGESRQSGSPRPGPPQLFPDLPLFWGSNSRAWDCKVTPVYGACQGGTTIYSYFTPSTCQIGSCGPGCNQRLDFGTPASGKDSS